MCAESLAFAAPGIVLWLGWERVFSERTHAVWTLDFIFAVGIVVQYHSIAPMRNLGLAQGLRAVLKAVTSSPISGNWAGTASWEGQVFGSSNADSA